jgi:DNA repair photolyase
LFYKPNAAELLERELSKPGYRVSNIALGANTDPYQPIERRLEVTRSILQVLARFRHPVGIITKGAMIERDLDLLTDLARDNLVGVGITLTTLDPQLKRTLEPRASSPQARLRVMRKLSAAGIPVRVMFSPVIPFVNDAELERVLQAAAEAGASTASYVLLRLPHELKGLFRDWLETHMPLKAAHVMSLIQQSRGGKDNDPQFGSRMKGTGQFAELIGKRFALARRRFGLDQRREGFNPAVFRVPPAAGDQMGLFGMGSLHGSG